MPDVQVVRQAAPGSTNGEQNAIKTGAPIGWSRLLWPPLLISIALLVLPQAAFVAMSFHVDTGMGQVADAYTLGNYTRALTDPFYLEVIGRTTYLSTVATLIGLLVGFPTAYALARIGGWLATMALTAILATSLITIVIKLIGLQLILGPSGELNQLLMGLGIVATPVAMVNNFVGVLIGLIQYTLPILILLLFPIAQTIPVQLEEAAEIHGATRSAAYFQIVVPIARQGLLGAGLIAFNMCMGAFTSPLILGGGRVMTLPVLIQQKMIVDSEYGMAATLSIVLVVLVFAFNLAVGAYILRGNPRRHAMA
jgi:putative spermidine/putrescine transport system permease protein